MGHCRGKWVPPPGAAHHLPDTPLHRQRACSVCGTCGSAGTRSWARSPVVLPRRALPACPVAVHQSVPKLIPELRQEEGTSSCCGCHHPRPHSQQPQPLLRALGLYFGFQIHVQGSISKSKRQSPLTPFALKRLSIFACGAVLSLVTVPRNYGRLTFFKDILNTFC